MRMIVTEVAKIKWGLCCRAAACKKGVLSIQLSPVLFYSAIAGCKACQSTQGRPIHGSHSKAQKENT